MNYCFQGHSSAGNSALESICGTSSDPIVVDEGADTPLQRLLRIHSDKIINQSSEYRLSVDTSSPDSLWKSAVCFYKGAKVKPKKLRCELMVEFDATGEVGVDSGALRKKFFQDTIAEAEQRLFEVNQPDVSLRRTGDWNLCTRSPACL